MKLLSLFLCAGALLAQEPRPSPAQAGGGGGGSGSVTSVGLVGTANQITVTGASPITSSGSWTISFPVGGVTLPGTTTGTFSGNVTGNLTGTASTATNALSLGGNLAATYAPLASPTFTGTLAIGTTLHTYATALSTPAPPTGVRSGTGGTTHYNYSQVTCVDALCIGHSAPSTILAFTTGNDVGLDATNKYTITTVGSASLYCSVFRLAPGLPGASYQVGSIGVVACGSTVVDTGQNSSFNGPSPINNSAGVQIDNYISGLGLSLGNQRPFFTASDLTPLAINHNFTNITSTQDNGLQPSVFQAFVTLDNVQSTGGLNPSGFDLVYKASSNQTFAMGTFSRFNGYLEHSGSAAVSNLVDFPSAVYNDGGATVQEFYNMSALLENDSGHVVTGAILSLSMSNSGTWDNAYGIKIGDISGAGTINRAIETGLGDIVLGTLKTTGAATGKKIVCVDTATGKLYASSSDVAGCLN